MHIAPSGNAYTCCMNTHLPAMGNVRQKDIKELWNHPQQKRLRQSMINDEPARECNSCYAVDASGGHSCRKYMNHHFRDSIKKISGTKNDGSLDKVEHIFWEVRFSNVCNLKCRSCSPELSTSWFEDGKLLGYETKDKILSLEGTRYLEHLEEFLPYVEEITFVGGEPLLSKEHYHILHRLLETGRTDVRLHYHTNFTISSFGKEDPFALWNKFENVWIFASIDGFGEKGEFIRKGMRWETILANKRRFDQICPKVKFTVFYTLSSLSILHLPEFLEELQKTPEFRDVEVTINFLHEPKYLSPRIFPAAFKAKITEKLEKFAKKYEGAPLSNMHTLQTALDFMNAENLETELPHFWEMMDKMDKIRGESVLLTFPELEGARLSP